MRNAAIPMSLALLLGSLASADTERIVNPANGHMYQRFDGGSTWHDAQAFCSLLGGHLATISTAQENQFVYTNFTHGWLGATDEQSEGTWQWVTGEPWSYTNWAPNEPTNCCPPEYCGGTGCTPEHYLNYWGSPYDGMWNDVPNGTNSFVCEWDSPADLKYEFTRLNFPGATETRAFGINPERKVVGWYWANDGAFHSFLWKDGMFTSFDLPGIVQSTMALSISPQGNIAGIYDRPDGSLTMHGFLLKQGGISQIDYPGATETWATDTTPGGVIVGPYILPDGSILSYALADGVYRSFAFPGTTMTYASGVNPAGDIVGKLVFGPDGPQPGFLLRKGEFQLIEYPGAMRTWAYGINPSRDIVGVYNFTWGEARGFLLSGGQFVPVNPPGARQTFVTRINSRGDMVGHIQGQDGRWHGFLLLRIEQP